MSKRYYLCDIVGDGTRDNPYRPAVANLTNPGVNYVAVIPSDPATGRPLAAWCLVLASTNNHARIQALPAVDTMPDVSLDTQWNSIDKTRSDAAKAALARRGIGPPSIAPGDGYRVFVRGLGRQLQPDFVEDNFDVADTA
jgi:hypothetical protein